MSFLGGLSGLFSRSEALGHGALAGDLSPFPEHSASSPLSVHGVTVAYREKPVLWDVEYEAPSGALIGVLGPNGAGKSTFVKACLGLIPLAAGRVEIFGRSPKAQRRRVGYVPQRGALDWDFPIDALDVATMGRYAARGWGRAVRAQDRARGLECLDAVGMADFAERQIGQLSGGQQQRVILARALAQDADLYFMDEPFQGVDAATEKAIVDVLRALRARGRTVIAVHHDLASAPDYFDHLLMLNMRVVASGPTTETFTRDNLAKTYGSKLTPLEDAAEAVRRHKLGS